MGNLVFQATLGGQVNLVGPNTASTYNINVPAVAGNMVTTGDTGTVTNTMLAGSIANAKLSNSAVTIGSTSVSLGATSTTLDGVNIGATTAGTGGFTSLAYSTTLTGGTGIVNLGSGQFYKDASGNVGIGTSATTYNYQTKNLVGYDATSFGISVASGTKILTFTAQASGGCYVGARSNDALIFTTNDTERARIDSSGQLIMGGTGNLGNSYMGIYCVSGGNDGIHFRPTTNASYASIVFQNNSGTTLGYISHTTTATAYNTSSDYRLKENIAPMTGALSVVQALKPCTYNWKVDGSDGQGFIAHELQAVVPDAVTGDKDAVDADGNPVYQGIDTSFLVATLTAAIQEQQALITQLQADVAALKAPQ